MVDIGRTVLLAVGMFLPIMSLTLVLLARITAVVEKNEKTDFILSLSIIVGIIQQ